MQEVPINPSQFELPTAGKWKIQSEAGGQGMNECKGGEVSELRQSRKTVNGRREQCHMEGTVGELKVCASVRV